LYAPFRKKAEAIADLDPRDRDGMRRLFYFASILVIGGIALALGGLLLVSSLAWAPAPAVIGSPPMDLPTEAVKFESASASQLSGWFIPGQPNMGAVLLMHGIRANRLAMLDRARLLHRHGFTVLLFDFQGHGESPGRSITFGYLESLDAGAALEYLRQRTPQERIGVIGVSLGGVAAVLADGKLTPDAMVLEAVYGTFDDAIANRLDMRLGALGKPLGSVFTWLVKRRLGFDPAVLQPVARIAELHAPLLLIAGEADQHTTLREMRELYERANPPKDLWIIAKATHEDFYRYAMDEYERRVIGFLSSWLRS
jgi:fermentation-respiration switch protein FrsA (DUF1100 family)